MAAIENADPSGQPGIGAAARSTFRTLIDKQRFDVSDPVPTGRQLLSTAGLNPADEFVLIQLEQNSTRSIGLDETVDLTAPGTEAFRAFKSDRIFRFILNDHGFEWGTAKISEPELREVGHVRQDEVIVLERDDEEVDLGQADTLDLSQKGSEHLHTEKRLVTVFFENEPREIPRGMYTTEQLKDRFGVQEGYILEFINREGHLTPLKPGQKIRVKDGMKFFEQVPCGGSS